MSLHAAYCHDNVGGEGLSLGYTIMGVSLDEMGKLTLEMLREIEKSWEIVRSYLEVLGELRNLEKPWDLRSHFKWHPIFHNSIHNIFIVSQHTSYMIHNASTQITFYWHIHIYILQWQAYIMGAKGAGNPIGFMGPLSDTLNLIYLNKGAGGARVQQW